MTTSTVASFQRWRSMLDGLAVRVHPERWQQAGVSPDAMARLTEQDRARRRLSLRLDWLSGGDSADGDVWPEWAEWPDADSAVLMALPALERRAARFGAALFRGEVATLVLGRDVQALKKVIGQDAYFFALRQGGLIREIAALTRDRVGEGELTTRIVQAGWLGLAAWTSALPDGLAQRVTYTMPLTIDAAAREVASWHESERAAWRLAMERVFILSEGQD